MVKFLNEHFPGEWRFGSATYIADVKQCIYFDKDELATMFMLKFGKNLKVVYER